MAWPLYGKNNDYLNDEDNNKIFQYKGGCSWYEIYKAIFCLKSGRFFLRRLEESE
jgi:hypothetical protein